MSLIRSIARFKLRIAAQLVLRRHRPIVIDVTGSVGKTGTKDAIACVLSGRYRVRKSHGNYNTEFGVPLAILGVEPKDSKIMLWAEVVVRFIKEILTTKYPQVLVLEMGADRIGDTSYLTSIAPPHISVVTRVGEAHLEFFKDMETVQREKSQLVSALDKEGVAVLNGDDPRVAAMASVCAGRVVLYGFSENADVKVSQVQVRQEPDANLGDPNQSLGSRFTICYSGKEYPMTTTGTLGRPHAYYALSAFAVGASLNIEPQEMIESLASFAPPPGRLRPIEGIKHTIILDDTYNSSPEALAESLRVLKQVRGRRRIAVLGDMLELGPITERAHRQIGRLVKDLHIDLLYTVGSRARFIADEARACGLAKTKAIEYDTSSQVGLPLQDRLKEGDVVLVKGSQGMRMERIVLEIMAYPEKARQLLVRQNKVWSKIP